MKNQIPWNKGKKVGSFITPDGLTRISLSSKSRKHTEEIKKRISAKMKGNRNANHRGDRQSFYNNIRMDSRWEVGVARWLDENEIPWKYSERGFKLSDGRYYYPDFFIYDNSNNFQKLIEVKGFFREENKKKFELFKEEYPEICIELWMRDKLKSLNIIDSSGYLAS